MTEPLRLGFSAGELDGMSAPDVAKTLDRYQAAGGSVIRFDIPWSGIQPSNAASFNWASPDATVAALRARGLVALPILTYTPAWARPAGCTDRSCGPADAQQFATYAAAVVARYAPQGVKNWEIWNEENTGWGPRPDVAAYGRLLAATSRAIHAVDPTATVLVGGLAPAASDGRNISPQDFVSGLYSRGFGDWFDAVAMHPYSFPALPGEGQAWSGWSQMLAVHDVMVAHGDTGKPVWATEFGAPTSGSRGMATYLNRLYSANPDHVDEDMQARTVDTAVAAARALPWLKALLWYSVQDLGTDPTANWLHFGLQRPDGTHKLAYAHWQDANRSLGS